MVARASQDVLRASQTSVRSSDVSSSALRAPSPRVPRIQRPTALRAQRRARRRARSLICLNPSAFLRSPLCLCVSVVALASPQRRYRGTAIPVSSRSTAWIVILTYNPCMIPRTLTARLKDAAAQLPVVTLTGPRQSGKTTLCRAAFPGKKYVNLEPLDTRELANASGARRRILRSSRRFRRCGI
jgi:hypothetical protein